jgi:hypothetical protein
MNLLKTVKTSAYVIAAIAGVMSYGHQSTLLLRAGSAGYSYAVPLTVDALAFIAALTVNSDAVDKSSRRVAAATLAVAGAMSIAANVAVGENLIQRVVGFWTVAAYLLAEWFVSRLKPKPEPVAEVAVEAETEAATTTEPAPEVDPEVFARRSEAARRGAATREAKRAAIAATAAKAAKAEARARKAAGPVETGESAVSDATRLALAVAEARQPARV